MYNEFEILHQAEIESIDIGLRWLLGIYTYILGWADSGEGC